MRRHRRLIIEKNPIATCLHKYCIHLSIETEKPMMSFILYFTFYKATATFENPIFSPAYYPSLEYPALLLWLFNQFSLVAAKAFARLVVAFFPFLLLTCATAEHCLLAPPAFHLW